jgi:RND family efflux transporter MFP subunit
MRKLLFGAGVAILAAVAWGAAGLFTSQTLPSLDAQDVETTTVQRIALTTTVETTGTLEAEQTAALTFDTSGIVEQILVEVGDEVVAGQELARLNTADLEYQIALQEQALIVQQTSYDRLVAEPTAEEIAQAQSSLASAQSQLRSAEASRDNAPNQATINCSNLEARQQTLDDALDDYIAYVEEGYGWDATFMPDPDSAEGQALTDAQNAYDVEAAQCSNITTDAEYELQVTAAQASVEQAQAALDNLLSGPTPEDLASTEAQLAQAQLELDNAREQLADAVLTAPFAGVIAENNLILGLRVTNGSQAMTLVDVYQIHVNVQVDELDIAQITIGQEASVLPDALRDTRIDGVVTRISPTGTNTDGVVTYDVRVELVDIADLPVRVGMTTEIEIVIASEGEVLAVPTEAIQRDGTTEFLEVVVEGGENRRVPVTTGRISDGMTEISGNISEGDVVVVPPQEGDVTGGLGGPFGGQQ